jgi:hypothetical protein
MRVCNGNQLRARLCDNIFQQFPNVIVVQTNDGEPNLCILRPRKFRSIRWPCQAETEEAGNKD